MFALTEKKNIESFSFYPSCFVCIRPLINEKALILSLKKLIRFIVPDLQWKFQTKILRYEVLFQERDLSIEKCSQIQILSLTEKKTSLKSDTVYEKKNAFPQCVGHILNI